MHLALVAKADLVNPRELYKAQDKKKNLMKMCFSDIKE